MHRLTEIMVLLSYYCLIKTIRFQRKPKLFDKLFIKLHVKVRVSLLQSKLYTG